MMSTVITEVPAKVNAMRVAYEIPERLSLRGVFQLARDEPLSEVVRCRLPISKRSVGIAYSAFFS